MINDPCPLISTSFIISLEIYRDQTTFQERVSKTFNRGNPAKISNKIGL